MALIECKDCKNQISDSAESCPKCGAPVEKAIGVDETQCPHCMTVISKKASTCPSCKAIKGYMYACECAANYCESCAQAVTNLENICWACIFTLNC